MAVLLSQQDFQEKMEEEEGAGREGYRLPVEVWMGIFSFLSGQEVAQLISLVSRDWLLIASEESLWRQICYRQFGDTILEDVEDYFVGVIASARGTAHTQRQHCAIPFPFWKRVYIIKSFEERYWWKGALRKIFKEISISLPTAEVVSAGDSKSGGGVNPTEDEDLEPPRAKKKRRIEEEETNEREKNEEGGCESHDEKKEQPVSDATMILDCTGSAYI